MADETLRGVQLTHRYADLGDVRLHYVEAGEGPLVLLLHGFPQFWYEACGAISPADMALTPPRS